MLNLVMLYKTKNWFILSVVHKHVLLEKVVVTLLNLSFDSAAILRIYFQDKC